MPSYVRHGDRNSMLAADRPLATTEIIDRVSARVKGLAHKDVARIWSALGAFVENQLRRGCAVHVPRLGTFGRSSASSIVTFFADPVFLQTNRLRDVSHRNGARDVLADSSAPFVNLAHVGDELLKNCGREIVQAVIANIVSFVGASAKEGRDVQLQMVPLGEWRCYRDVVSFQFSSDFQMRLTMMSTRISDQTNTTKGKRSNGKEIASAPSEKSMSKEPSVFGGSNQDESAVSLASALSRACLVKSAASTRSSQNTINRISQRTKVLNENGKLTHRSVSSKPDDISSSTKGRSKKAASESSRSSTASSLSKKSNQSSARVSSKTNTPAKMRPEATTLKKIIMMLVKRQGHNALNMFNREMERLGVNARGNMSLIDLKQALLNLGVTVSIPTLDAVMSLAPRSRDGSVPFKDFFLAVRGGNLHSLRRELITKTFQAIIPRAGGILEISCLRDKSNKIDEDHPLAKFVHEWGSATKSIGLDQFIIYYHNISACMVDDSTFEQLLNETWMPMLENQGTPKALPGIDQELASKSSLSTPLTCQDNSSCAQEDTQSEWSYLRTILCPNSGRSPSIDDICRKLGVNRIWGDGNETMNRTAFAHAIGLLDRSLHSKDALHLSRVVANVCEPEDIISLSTLYSRLSGEGFAILANKNIAHANINVVDRVRSRIFGRIAHTQEIIDRDIKSVNYSMHHVGLNGLQRSLKLMDTTGGNRLTKDELKIGLCKFGVDVNYHEIDYLFTYFDADRSGCINADEFLVGMRGEMSTRRTEFVHKAFELLDHNGNGKVSLDELFSKYDTTKHPDVMSGKLTPDQAIQLFARQWKSGNPDGVITKQEFETYYQNLSPSINSDIYFELMMRNVWHIPDGEDQCCNNTNHCVLVTDAGGRQHMTELYHNPGTEFIETQKHATKANKVSDSRQECAFKWAFPKSENLIKEPKQEQSLTVKKLRPFHRRQMNLNEPFAHEAKQGITSNFFQLEEIMPVIASGRQRNEERNLREKAAQLIQSHFRGFRGRRFVACVRRKLAFDAERKRVLKQENQSARPKIQRAALRSFHGF